MSKIEELLDAYAQYNKIMSLGIDGTVLIAERLIIDDPTSTWKLTMFDQNGNPIHNDPPFEGAYNKTQLVALAQFGNYVDWNPVPIDFLPGSRLEDGKGYIDSIIPKY